MSMYVILQFFNPFFQKWKSGKWKNNFFQLKWQKLYKCDKEGNDDGLILI